ncbi:MAG: methyltransferase domain-containing protein [Solirubrobacteraceae bacterium]|nr:methyltransferase domain-containing protein [Solirubrobacteraceae bacterium]
MSAPGTIAPPSADEVRASVEAVPLWYHTLDLPHGITTPGWFDLRPIIDRMPWPDVRGKRCLDVGTWDGHLAFEMERRGASEVVAIDLADHSQWDVPFRGRPAVAPTLEAMVGDDKAAGFATAHRLLGSRVRRREISVYDLSPDTVGEFDVVVCGSLMLHLRDPIRAMEAIRSVTAGAFLSAEGLRLRATLMHPRRPMALLDADPAMVQWWHPNLAGHRRMLYAAGFRIVRQSRPYVVRLGAGHPTDATAIHRALALGRRVLLGSDGLPHVAILTRPDPDAHA